MLILQTYDVYFGKNNPPTAKISQNINTVSFDVTLDPATEYFCKVAAKDNKVEKLVVRFGNLKPARILELQFVN